MAVVSLTIQARADLKGISWFYKRLVGKDSATRRIALIRQDLFKLADNPMLGSTDEAIPGYQYWYVSKTDYRVYFKRLGPKSIKVYRIWSSRQRPLEPDDVIP